MNAGKTWRQRSRREIQENGIAARKALLAAEKYSLKVTIEDDGVAGLIADRRTTPQEELEYLSAGLGHLQEAESKVAMLRTLLTKRRERLQEECEREIAYGPDVYAVVKEAEKKRKRLPPEVLARAIHAEWVAAQEQGNADTPWGKRLTLRRIGAGLNVSESTVRKYLKAEEEVIA